MRWPHLLWRAGQQQPRGPGGSPAISTSRFQWFPHSHRSGSSGYSSGYTPLWNHPQELFQDPGSWTFVFLAESLRRLTCQAASSLCLWSVSPVLRDNCALTSAGLTAFTVGLWGPPSAWSRLLVEKEVRPPPLSEADGLWEEDGISSQLRTVWEESFGR